MKSNTTIYDIAEAANVSTTSVYKALHKRKGISEETRKQILDIARKQGYKMNTIAQTLARGEIRIGVVVDHYSPEYIGEVLNGMNAAFTELSDYKVQGVFGELSTNFDKTRVLKNVKEVCEKNIDGLILCPGISYKEYEDITEELNKKEIPLITITNDILGGKRLTTICNNARIVGELGAEILDFFTGSEGCALFIGNKDIIGHRELIEGFSAKLGEKRMSPIAIYETQEDDTLAYHAIEILLRKFPEVKGIFVGTSHSVGICRKIVECGRSGEIKIVCVDTYPQILDYLQQGVIQATIFQNPFKQGKTAVKTLYDYITSGTKPEAQILINPSVVLKSNCKFFY